MPELRGLPRRRRANQPACAWDVQWRSFLSRRAAL